VLRQIAVVALSCLALGVLPLSVANAADPGSISGSSPEYPIDIGNVPDTGTLPPRGNVMSILT
jgi:hypothetical protein